MGLTDGGGTPNGGQDTNALHSCTIKVIAVNDQPSFAKGNDQNVADNAGPQQVLNWATGISAGPANENGQIANLSFDLRDADGTPISGSDLFSAAPVIVIDSPNGHLTYTPKNGAKGTANITLKLEDHGGT